MSMKKRRQQAAEEAELEAQNAEIRKMFKKQRLADEVGQIKAEKLFPAITGRMDRRGTVLQEPPLERPDYGINEEEQEEEEEEEGEEEEEWPAPPPPIKDEEKEEEEEEKEEKVPPRQQWEAPSMPEFLEKANESNRLLTFNSLITRNRHNPNYVVKDKN